MKKILSFFLLDTMFPHSTVLFCHPSRTRYFIFIGSRFNLCWSAPVTHQVQGDCVLSQIHVLQAQCLKHGPWSIRTPENLRCHTVFNWFITDLMVVSQPLVDSRYRRITGSKQRFAAVGGCSSYQSHLVVLYQPLCRFTAAPKMLNETINASYTPHIFY